MARRIYYLGNLFYSQDSIVFSFDLIRSALAAYLSKSPGLAVTRQDSATGLRKICAGESGALKAQNQPEQGLQNQTEGAAQRGFG